MDNKLFIELKERILTQILNSGSKQVLDSRRHLATSAYSDRVNGTVSSCSHSGNSCSAERVGSLREGTSRGLFVMKEEMLAPF